MPKYTRFDELPAWQMAARLYNQVLDLFEKHASLFTPAFVVNLTARPFPFQTTSPKVSTA